MCSQGAQADAPSMPPSELFVRIEGRIGIAEHQERPEHLTKTRSFTAQRIVIPGWNFVVNGNRVPLLLATRFAPNGFGLAETSPAYQESSSRGNSVAQLSPITTAHWSREKPTSAGSQNARSVGS